MAMFPFVGPAYRARSALFDAQRCVNLYPELSQSGTSKSVAALYGTPGLAVWATLPTGPVRGMLRLTAGTALVVAGGSAYQVAADGSFAAVGTVTGGNTPVSMASNGTDVMIVTGPSGYRYRPSTGGFDTIVDPDFLGADAVGFLDGYFVFNKPGTGQLQWTTLYGTDIEALDFATAEGSPDLLLSLLVDHRELWAFGERTVEVFFNSGNQDQPLERIQGAFIEHGCAAKYSPAKLDNGVYWLGADEAGAGVVYRAQGYQPQRVSDHGVEYALARMPRLDDAVGWSYQQEGHPFYVLSFPTAQQTWVFDTATSMWHERAWRNPATGLLEAHRALCHMAFAGLNLVGDRESGTVYRLDLDTYTDNGDAIPRIRACAHLASELRLQYFDALQVDMEAGVGLASGQGSEPQAMLRWSDDGGRSWGVERWAALGRLGQRRTRVRWRRLGRSRDRVFELTITDPVRVAIVGAAVDVTQGSA